VDCDALIAQVQNQDPKGLVLKDVYRGGTTAPRTESEPSQQHASQTR
jgi:hypothetical protein